MKAWLLVMLLVTVPALAQFDIDGSGKVVMQNGRQQEFDFGFSLFRQDGRYRFIVGRHSLDVQTVPQKYSLFLILQDEKSVWVSDFINEPLEGFEFAIDEYQIRLFKDAESNAKGQFILQVNDERFQFSRGPGQINFLFTERGIKEVNVEGMFKPRR